MIHRSHSAPAYLSRVAVILAGCLSAVGQVINDGNSSFNMPAANSTGATIRTGDGGGLNAAFTAGGDSTDQVFQQWWWYRVNNVNTREFGFSNRTGNTAVGNQLTLSYTEPEGFGAVLVYTLHDGQDAPASANVSAELRLTNTTANDLSLAVYCYLDYDIEGSGSDAAVLVEPGRIRITDATGFFGQFLGVNASAYQVTAYDSLRVLLANTVINNLNNGGLPFAASDWTGGFQWNLSIPAGQTQTIRAALSLNMDADAGGECPGDFDGSGTRDLQDLAILLSAFGVGAAGDMDGDGDTDLQDLANLLSVFGSDCP